MTAQSTVEAARRLIDSFNRGDVDAFVEELDPEVEFLLALPTMFGGESTVYRGHEGIREWLAELGETFAEFQVELSEIRERGERALAIGHLRGRGKESGAEVGSPVAYLTDFKNGKVIRMEEFLDPRKALKRS